MIYKCKLDPSHKPMTDLTEAIIHAVHEAVEKKLDLKEHLGEFLEEVEESA
jgi:hypothetical protein